MELHSSLPFSSLEFFLFSAISVAIFWIQKFTKPLLPYKWMLAIVSVIYIAILYPKPLSIVGLILFEYLSVLGLRKWYKSDNVIFPMLWLALPIFLMKTSNIYGTEDTSSLIFDARKIIQIAGLSYMVFKVIGLYIDERKSTYAIPFLDFFIFTSFIPTLLIGPIDRFPRFQDDIKKGYDNIVASRIERGWQNIIKGLLYKFIIAEFISRYIIVRLTDDGSLLYHSSYMYSYLFYLFFDFAGYSLLAIGYGNLLGVEVPINFNKPFLSVNPKEFWKRWHKSLGDWLGDYFFKPIFKDLTSRKIFTSITRQNIALFLTFTLMGFWNGFELHFIVSGMLFGLYSVIHNSYIYQCKKKQRDVFFGRLNERYVQIFSIFIMINIVAFAIYIFSGELI